MVLVAMVMEMDAMTDNTNIKEQEAVPQAFVTEEMPLQPKKRWLKPIIIAAVAIILVPTLFFAISKISKFSAKKQLPVAKEQIKTKAVVAQDKIEKDILESFDPKKAAPRKRRVATQSATSKTTEATLDSLYKQISDSLKAAKEVPSLQAAYQHYIKAYQAMIKIYKQTKDKKQKQTIADLKDYLLAFPQYKEGDIKVPK